jgi:WD40-like Beta Propeller Repeat
VASNAWYVQPGYLLFVRHSLLVAQPFSPRRLELTGQAIPLAEGLFAGPFRRFAPFSASAGVLAYRAGSMQKTRLVRVDRDGRTVGVVGAPARYLTPVFSPVGTFLAVDLLDVDGESTDIWVFDLARETSSRVTFGPGFDGYPLWTPDGKSIVYASEHRGTWSLRQRSLAEPRYVRPFSSTGAKWRISKDGGCQPRWRRDGMELFYRNIQHILSAPIERGAPFGPSVGNTLFQTPAGRTARLAWDYDVAPDGRQFLVKELVYDEGASPMVVVVGWQALLTR